ncbi:Peptidyl-prolyl cis-trans isomerase cyp15 [Neolecta irregularis DAH-3]|uniref:peptidylprolyl isomerase n=1 Tax=Neolecta irregularis (strain DAH-3) TaxID=1198029 RepID=A0A1U7LK12_NEOID|nr:Peptidyl-prolyl cis-trans isomerase cyp15 [Neolecta irregularis DAH-3]|eukprot:OLL22861.1 Peptidyl-prolyl cis-trans isomerase cyp15 [Neolecta irregularis DAH-3]
MPASPKKRPAAEHGSSSSEDDVGPNLPLPSRKRKHLAGESTYLGNLPSTPRYTTSFMHKENLSHIIATPTDFIITCSIDGRLKFWKKTATGIDFVKVFRVFMGPFRDVKVSYDGVFVVCIGEEGGVRIFDLIRIDMINLFELGLRPKAACWVYNQDTQGKLIAVSSEQDCNINIYDAMAGGHVISTVSIHRKPVHLMSYNPKYNTTISVDIDGMIEYWTPEGPKPQGLWDLKSSTDLYQFRKSKSIPTVLRISPKNDIFATFSLPDRVLQIWDFSTGKIKKTYLESLSQLETLHSDGAKIYHLDDIEFGKRLAVEREMQKSGCTGDIYFDESGYFLIYSTLYGIKVINTFTDRCRLLLGKDDSIRFDRIAVYQGAPTGKKNVSMQMAASDNPLLEAEADRDPVIFATGWKKNRFYLFTKHDIKLSDRDVFNEKPTILNIENKKEIQKEMGTEAIIHTTFGDIKIRLYPDKAPLAVENFVTLARRGYYDRTIFHRVIRKFMIQGGDPLGDGTGGESIWGRGFKDEFSDLKHDRPFTVSMANAGPSTNGSQFFITTAETNWLDGKHTIFGRATGGLDVISRIERLKTDKLDRPEDPVDIINVDVI